MNLCRVPIVSTPGCSARQAKESAFEAAARGSGASSAPQAPQQAQAQAPVPILQRLRFTGMWPLMGFDPTFDATTLAQSGAAAVRNGTLSRVVVVGASTFYNDYVTGFLMYAETHTARYYMPKRTALPPVPPQFKDDLLWVASLRRGPYPDLISGRPRVYSPKMTDPLQNGEVASMSPAVVFGGQVPLLSTP
jgi:hypothetical protein